MSVKRLVFDYDYMKYAIAAVCEVRSVIVTHKKSGNVKEFENRTEFWGKPPRYDGGWLGELNKERAKDGKEAFTKDDFEITDRQEPQPVSHMNNTVKQHINNICKVLGATSYYGYIGKGESWRVGASRIIEYKGNRKDTIKPLMLPEIEEYLTRRHDATIITQREADDEVVIDCMKNPQLTLVGVDKDYYGSEPITFFNPDKMSEPLYIAGLGKLWIEEKAKSSGRVDKTVRGIGRKWFYFQVMSGDSSDNYFANSATTTKWGDMSAYKLLEKCETDEQCWAAIVSGYKKLYPEPFKFTGWRGDELDLDWKSVLEENCTMAHMLRKPDDKFVLDEVLDRFGVKA